MLLIQWRIPMFEQLLKKHNQAKFDSLNKNNVFVVTEWSFVKQRILDKDFLGVVPKSELNVNFDNSSKENIKMAYENNSLLILHSGCTIIYKNVSQDDLETINKCDIIQFFYNDEKGMTFISSSLS